MAVDTSKSIQQHLVDNRMIHLSGDITTGLADFAVGWLLTLDSLDAKSEIKIYISSFGGSVYAGLAIYDAMQMVQAPLSTICIGPAFSMAAWLLAAGDPGRRYATPHSRIMLHQASTGLIGTTTDIRVAAQNILHTEKVLNELLARHTRRSPEEIAQAIQRDLWLDPEEAVAFGIIDAIAPPHPEKARLNIAPNSSVEKSS